MFFEIINLNVHKPEYKLLVAYKENSTFFFIMRPQNFYGMEEDTSESLKRLHGCGQNLPQNWANIH